MIRPLRQRHRRMVLALGLFLPVAFAVGLAARKPVPTVSELPSALAIAPQRFETVEWQRAGLFTNVPVAVRLLREQKAAGEFAAAFSAPDDFLKPDLLVYWVAGRADLTGALPDNAILLGAFGATPLPLPDGVAKSDGRLVLFSLADGEIESVSAPFRWNDSN
jgi:hypothetical protein